MLEDYVVIDLEMTGLNAKTDAILEVGAVRVRDGRQTETYGAILKCGRELSERVVELTGITRRWQTAGTGRGDMNSHSWGRCWLASM
ncbi:PolC-type DNA polymerase III [Clostridium fessum]|uniref:3'-5' exonuclease n=1 Tax=Clostridium fessum TaxID=2126740 RepID=UPI00399BACD4